VSLAHWQTKTSKIVYENPWIVVHEDEVVMPNGKDGLFGYVESKSDSIYVVPVDDEGNTYLTQQERYPIQQITWECVAGRTDGQTLDFAAKRELLEETGVAAKTMTPIATVHVANGITTFTSTFYIARNLTLTNNELDAEDGILGVKKVPLHSLPDMILRGEITCSQSIAAFLTAIAYIEREKQVY
jgi:8-oxo-dGTP pyrophosphatase MutT (NUDIX family)